MKITIEGDLSEEEKSKISNFVKDLDLNFICEKMDGKLNLINIWGETVSFAVEKTSDGFLLKYRWTTRRGI